MLARSTSAFTVTTVDDSGQGSLRDVIERANAAGEATITFALGGGPAVFRLQSPLPPLAFSGALDGCSQLDSGQLGPVLEINGAAADGGHGLEIVANGLVVRGLAVTEWKGDGIFVNAARGIVLTRLYAGIRLDGLTEAGNAGAGIHLVGSADCIVGGDEPNAGVVLSGNFAHGLFLDEGTRNTRVLGSFFGTDRHGASPIANGMTGVKVTQAPANIIGGKSASSRNVISGNTYYGISITGPEARDTIAIGNFVGVDASGTTAIPNIRSGVLVINVPACRIGGSEPGERNVISGNTRAGVTVDGSLIHLGVPMEHGGLGYTKGVSVEGNYVGLDHTGTHAVPNKMRGILVNYCQTNRVIGNVVSGNEQDGILILGPKEDLDERVVPSDNLVIRNIIGLTADGEKPLGNGRHGVYVQNGKRNVIGGMADPTDANIIKHNAKRGVTFRGLGFDTNILGTNIIDQNGLSSFYQAS